MTTPRRNRARRMWAWIIRDGKKPELVPWGEGNYWQMPIFHTRRDAKAWRVEHLVLYGSARLVRATVAILPLRKRGKP